MRTTNPVRPKRPLSKSPVFRQLGAWSVVDAAPFLVRNRAAFARRTKRLIARAKKRGER